MAEPFSVVAISAAATFEIAKKIVQSHSNRLADSALGKLLKKLGLLNKDLYEKLVDEISVATENYFSKNRNYKTQGIVNFWSNPKIAEYIGEHILNCQRIEIDYLRDQLSDTCDIPRKEPSYLWPNGLIPERIIYDFVDEIKTTMSRSDDTSILYIGNNIGTRLDRIESSIQSLEESLPSIFDTINRKAASRKISEFEQHYLQHLAARANHLTTPGVRELHGVKQSLDLAYISLTFKLEDQNDELIRAEDFFYSNPLTLVTGPAGSGKTTLLNWLIMQCSEMNTKNIWSGGVPFFVRLRAVARIEKSVPQVRKFAEYSVDLNIWDREIPENWVAEVLKEKRGIIMLDGIDEFPRNRREDFWAWVQEIVNDYPGNRVIVTSRPLPSSSLPKGKWPVPKSFVFSSVQSMSDIDVRNFIEHWHDAVDTGRLDALERAELQRARSELPNKLKNRENRAVRELCGTPLLCAMVCVLNWREEGYLPDNKLGLYEKCCDVLLDARDVKRQIVPPAGSLSYIQKNDKEMILQRLAFDMMRNSVDESPDARIEVAKSQAIEWIGPYISLFQKPEARSCDPEAVLDYLLERTGLIREPAGGLIDFPHRSFQDYLAAGSAGAQSQYGFLAKQAGDFLWHETIVLAAGTASGGVGFGRSLIEALLNRAQRFTSERSKSVRIKKTCIALALACLSNLKQHDEELRDRVLSQLKELVPPKDGNDASVLALAGDAAVPHLKGNSENLRQHSVVREAIVNTLRLIGTDSAESCAKDYYNDTSDRVLVELCRIPSVKLADLPEVFTQIRKTKAVPPFLPIYDAYQLEGLNEYVEKLTISGDTLSNNPIDIGSLKKLKDLKLLELSREYFDGMKVPDSVEDIHIYGMQGKKISFNSEVYSKLKNVAVSYSRKLDTVEIPNKHGSLSTLTFWAVPNLKNCVTLDSATSLRKIQLIDCGSEQLLPGKKVLEDLESLVVREENLSNVSSLASCAALNELEISCVGNNIKYDALRDLRRLTSFTMENCTTKDFEFVYDLVNLLDLALNEETLTNIDKIGALEKLTTLSLNCRNVNTLKPLLECSNLSRVALIAPNSQHLKEISSVNKLKRIVIIDAPARNLSYLKKITSLKNLELVMCRQVNDINFIKELNSLKKLSLIDCPKIKSLKGLEKLPNLERIILTHDDDLEIQENLARRIEYRPRHWLRRTFMFSNFFMQIGGHLIASNGMLFSKAVLPGISSFDGPLFGSEVRA